MIARFFASIIANVSEELLGDLFRAIIREIVLKRKKTDFSKAVDRLESVINELSKEAGVSDDEKNAKLIAVGRDVVARLRD